MRTTADSADFAPGGSHARARHHPHGWRRRLLATHHQHIGTLHLWFFAVMCMAGGVPALLIRLEPFQPGLQFFQPEPYNQFVTLDGLVMICGAIMPAFVGCANRLAPLQVRASDMAFARMFTTGMPVTGPLFFMCATMPVAVPTGVKVFNRVAPMWKGSLSFESPMLFAVGFIRVFTIGGFSGLILSVAPIDAQMQDTCYVVAHFPYFPSVLAAG